MTNSFQGFVDAINEKRHANGLLERAYDANWEGAVAAIQELNYGFVDVGQKPAQYEYTYADDGTTITGVYKARNVGNGSLWFDTRQGRMFVYYDDDTTEGWYQTNGGDGYTMVSPNAPTTDITGMNWFNSSNNRMYVWDGAQWKAVDGAFSSGLTEATLPLSTANQNVTPSSSLLPSISNMVDQKDYNDYMLQCLEALAQDIATINTALSGLKSGIASATDVNSIKSAVATALSSF